MAEQHDIFRVQFKGRLLGSIGKFERWAANVAAPSIQTEDILPALGEFEVNHIVLRTNLTQGEEISPLARAVLLDKAPAVIN